MRKEPDVTLERILSLIPKKPDGKYVHGEKKKFAESIGYDSGDIVSMWINGSSSSYKGKIHEISMKYGVSVDWLEGKTDIKEPTGQGEIDEVTRELFDIVLGADDEERAAILEVARLMKKRRPHDR